MKQSSAKDTSKTKNNPKDLLPIAGIGASAGGLNALREFFNHVPEDSGVAYVVVVHLSPEHKSLLAELLQPYVKIPVTQVTQTMKLEANHVYVIPPNANLNAIDTHLRLSELEHKRGERAPIDHFFYTLAVSHKGSAIGVILTGTGSDGTLGIKEIKAQGGLTIVQKPEEAEFDGMPQSAITTGIIDQILPLAEIPAQIIKYISTSPHIPFLKTGKEPGIEESRKLLSLKNEDRMRILVDTMFDLVYRLSPDWSAMIELNGKQFLADTIKPDINWISKYIPAGDHSMVKAAIHKSLQNMELFDLEHRVIRVDGSIGYVRSRALPIKDENGKIIEWQGVALDITAQKDWEAKLAAEKKYAESIVETLHEPVIVLNPDLTVRSANPAFYEDFKVKPEETIGVLIYELGNNQWKIPKLRALLEDVLPDNTVFKDYIVEHEFETIGRKVMLLNARRLDHVQYILLGIRDITERQRYEEEIHKAKEMAEDAARIKEQFLAHMSHEIRTPLNAIVGMSYLMMEQPDSELQQTRIATIRTAAENLHQLINNVLDYSKLKSGKWQLLGNTVNLRETINDLAVVHQTLAKEKNVTLEVAFAKEIPSHLILDEPKLIHVLNNLVSNAVKFTREGSVTLEVKQVKRRNKKIKLEFSVTDTGIGMDEQQLKTIFDEFTQVDHSTMKHFKGTGLGLSIVKMYLQIMGSDIRVESTPGKGSRFWFELIVDIADVEEAEPVIETMDTAVDGAQLLVVEDDEFSRMLLSEILKMWGISHDVAVDGREAVQMARSNNYDMVLIDVHMPDIDGFEATRLIRDLSYYKDKPIYAVTADVSRSVAKAVDDNLFSGKVLKPYDPDELYVLIKKVLA